jgi:hypothetical protein
MLASREFRTKDQSEPIFEASSAFSSEGVLLRRDKYIMMKKRNSMDQVRG